MRKSALSRSSSGSEKGQLAREISKNAREMTNRISKWSQSRKLSKCVVSQESRGNSDEINIKKF